MERKQSKYKQTAVKILTNNKKFKLKSVLFSLKLSKFSFVSDDLLCFHKEITIRIESKMVESINNYESQFLERHGEEKTELSGVTIVLIISGGVLLVIMFFIFAKRFK